MSHPDWKAELYIEADASSGGVGAVLSHIDKNTGKLLPVHFFSSSLSASKKNYSAGQLEAWALVASTRKWEVYLKGATGIILLTDHWPLSWLETQRDPKLVGSWSYKSSHLQLCTCQDVGIKSQIT